MTATAAYMDRAGLLADELNIDLVAGETISDSEYADCMILRMDNEGLALLRDGMTIRGDFSQMKKRLNPANLNHEMLVKAAKLKDMSNNPVLVDATAGLGEDSILLAAAGFHVKMFERDCIIAALLQDALDRAAEDAQLISIVERMELVKEDSIAAMNRADFTADVVYLDPMFPARSKSGLIKKKFQLLQQIESPCEEGEILVNAARQLKPKKIVIKRPLKGEYLSAVKPNYSIEGRAIRYDCLI